ncbi:MAG: NAD(P)H-dependent glycerol-3-phosphate dehydrogenase [Planctomycetota bacterium]
MTLTVIGAGSFGTALASMLSQRHPVALYCRDPKQALRMARTRRNPTYLKDLKLSPSVTISSEAAAVLPGATLVVLAIPCQYLRQAARNLKPHLHPKAILVSTSKGLELGTLLRPSEVLSQTLPRHAVMALSGPTHAEEVAAGLPSTAVLAGKSLKQLDKVASLFHSRSFRIYTNTDVTGVEIAGAVKNVIALAAGVCDGLRLGDNAKAALITRGLVEIKRFGMKQGARASTFDGLSGLGDLITTCFSPFGRNLHVGRELGRGKSLKTILGSMTQVAEGVPTTRAVVALARKLKVEMPIAGEMDMILRGKRAPMEALKSLMGRAARREG